MKYKQKIKMFVYDIVPAVFFVLAITGTSAIILSSLLFPSDPVQRQEQQEKTRLEKITANMESLNYWVDTSTGICYARLWSGMANGGPALATVPCEKLSNPTPFKSEK